MTETATALPVARKIVQRKISDLIAAEYNPRQLTTDQHKALKDSMMRFGFVDPALINVHPDRKDIIIGGHQRIKVWAEMGNTKAPCVEMSLDRDQERELNVRLNLNTGEFDFDLLANNFDVDQLVEWGFTEDDLTGFAEPPDVTEDETPDPPDDPITETGRIYQLGRHRLMCGDSTKAEDVNRLMDGEKADMVFTDPPYGISIIGSSGKLGGAKSFGSKTGTIGSSNVVDVGEYHSIIGDDTIETALSSYRIFEAMGVEQIIMWGGQYYAHAMPPAKCWLIWDKETTGSLGDGEIAWTNIDRAVKIFRHKWSGMIKASEHGQRRSHPTQKPIALAAFAFDEFKAGNIILDGFGGSGSTLIACEQTGRACRMMEIDPRYCDVIVRRYANFVKTDAQAIFDTGAHLVEVAA